MLDCAGDAISQCVVIEVEHGFASLLFQHGQKDWRIYLEITLGMTMLRGDLILAGPARGTGKRQTGDQSRPNIITAQATADLELQNISLRDYVSKAAP